MARAGFDVSIPLSSAASFRAGERIRKTERAAVARNKSPLAVPLRLNRRVKEASKARETERERGILTVGILLN